MPQVWRSRPQVKGKGKGGGLCSGGSGDVLRRLPLFIAKVQKQYQTVKII